MKIKISAYSSIMLLISSVVLFILGALIYSNPNAVVLVVTYVIGGLITLAGVFNCVKNYIEVKKDNTTSSKGMVLGIMLVVIGLIFIFLGGVIETLVRFIIGGWILLCGITRLANALSIEKKETSFWVLLVLSEKNLVFQTLGLILMIYAILEIFGHVFSRKEGIMFENETTKPEESKVKEAEVVEDTKVIETKEEIKEEPKNKKKEKKDKKNKKK